MYSTSGQDEILLGYSANSNTGTFFFFLSPVPLSSILYCFFSHSSAEILVKGDLNATLPPSSAPIVLTRGAKNSFDECGAWLNIFYL
jgi:hypothetical protein